MLRFYLLLVFTSLLYETSTGKSVETPTSKVIFWVVKAGDIKMHESVVIDDKQRTILMISSEAYKNNDDNSLALHDFQTGNVAFRNFRHKVCFVGQIHNPDFGAVKAVIEDMEGKELPLPEVRRAQLTTKRLTSSELGPRLSSFCKGLPAHWFYYTSKRETRSSVMHCPSHYAEMQSSQVLQEALMSSADYKMLDTIKFGREKDICCRVHALAQP